MQNAAVVIAGLILREHKKLCKKLTRGELQLVMVVECLFLCALHLRFYSHSEGHEPTLVLIKTTAKEVSEIKGD